MSEDLLLARLARRHGLVESPLGAIAAPYVNALRAERYSLHTIHSYLSAVAHFGYWIRTQEINLCNIGPNVIDQYLGHLNTCACPSPRRTDIRDNRAALRFLLRLMLRDDLGGSKEIEVSTPIQAELERFQHYLSNICGLAANTCNNRMRHVQAFLKAYHRAPLTEVRLPTRQDIERFFTEVAQRWTPASLHVIRGSLNSYFRFRALAGDQTQMLVAALPSIADWSRANLPKALSDEQLDMFLQAFDRTNPTGQRDYAIARCLVDLGLRGQEVTQLQLAAVDWRGGTLVINGSKGKRVGRLPLPSRTAQAIAQYLRHGRPQTSNRAVFVRHVAPFDKPLKVAALCGAMNRAFIRCGLGDLFCNTHVLRHTVAVRLQRSGASLKEIADVLRHRNLDTTTRYTRVDLDGLRAVALPWPGDPS
jgi:integrase/recombinase XerD